MMAIPRRPETDLYLAAVRDAVHSPGSWVVVRRTFDTEANAGVTASCLRGGYLRVIPYAGDDAIDVSGKRYLRTAAPVQTRITKVDGGWCLEVRA